MKCKYNINNLDCANCALKIEKKLNNDKNIKKAIVNFSNLKLTIETDYKGDLIKYINNIIKEIEPDTYIYEKEKNNTNKNKDIIILTLGIVIGIFGLFIKVNNIVNNIILISAYAILLYKVFINALKLLFKEHIIDENLLISISCIGAYLINKPSEGLMVIALYKIGKILEGIAVNNSRKSISDLMDIKPEFANLKVNNKINKVNPNEVKIDDIIVIKEGEEVPLDGIVIKGSSKLNTSSLTGESKLVYVDINDSVLSGSINVEGLIEVRVTDVYENSTVNKILELLENATDKKTKVETTVSKFAKIYTPCVLILSILLIIFGCIFDYTNIGNYIYKALVFLVISCPCAIAISVPLSYFTGIGVASKYGILIKGSEYLDILKDIKKIIFDKTGTLTTGKFEDIEIELISDKFSKDYIYNIILKGESLSNHPIAHSIVKYINKDIDNSDVVNFKEEKGLGISFEVDNNKILIGNYKLCNVNLDKDKIYVSINEIVVASISIVDKIKEEASDTIKLLKKNNIKCLMFTGDNRVVACNIGNKLNIDEVYSELLPNEKYELLQKNIDSVVAFVGDGVNDAISLKSADIGISMGGIGSSIAIESSDIVIMNDNLKRIVDAIKISKLTTKIVKQNLLFALIVKLLVLILSALGISSMWQAVFADVGVTVLCILNTVRIFKYKDNI